MTCALLMASGLGTRLRPLTLTTPKPLLQVQGKPMIETLIEALLAHDVTELYIAVGYLAEQFRYLTTKYSSVHLVLNPDYCTANNISSVYYACQQLPPSDCYICESDLFVADPSIFSDRPQDSCYFGEMVSGHTDDWCFSTAADGCITRVGKGGEDCFNMVGVSYWTSQDLCKLSHLINEAYTNPANHTLFWDDIVNRHLDRLSLFIHPISAKALIEIDTFEELKTINKVYYYGC